MFGAILGDSICSPCDYNKYYKGNFNFHYEGLHYSDNTIMSIAVSNALLNCREPELLKNAFTESLMLMEDNYSNISITKSNIDDSGNIHSDAFSNNKYGAIVRVSSIPYYFVNDFEMTRLVARLSAEATEHHPELIHSAEAVAGAIWLAIHGKSKKDIRKFLVKEFDCLNSVVLTAFSAFNKGNDYENVIENVKSIDHDTACLATIAGGLAEAYYGMTEEQEDACFDLFGIGMSALNLRSALLNFEIVTNRAVLADPVLRQGFLT